MKNYVIPLISDYCIFTYVIILFAERLQSVVRIFRNDMKIAFADGFNVYVNLFVIASLVATLVVLFVFNQTFLKAIFIPTNKNVKAVDMKMVCVLIAVILFAGMVHTEYTINGVQFASYGILIAALILYTVMNQKSSENIFLLWSSLIYLVCLSMAIPVMYRSQIRMHVLFHIIEAVVSIALVCAFAYLSYLVFTGRGTNLFMAFPFAIAVIGDVCILAMRWKEQINSFVLIFLIASVVLWLLGKIVSMIR